MKFFDSEIVKKELEEIQFLQERIYNKIFSLSSMDREEKLDHIQTLQDLLERQKILYTRLKLSDDEEAIRIRKKIEESAVTMGMPENFDMNVVFNNMSNIIENMKNSIERA